MPGLSLNPFTGSLWPTSLDGKLPLGGSATALCTPRTTILSSSDALDVSSSRGLRTCPGRTVWPYLFCPTPPCSPLGCQLFQEDLVHIPLPAHPPHPPKTQKAFKGLSVRSLPVPSATQVTGRKHGFVWWLFGLRGSRVVYIQERLRRPHRAALKDWTKFLHKPGSQFSHS